MFSGSKPVQDVILKYLKKLTQKELISQISLLSTFKRVPAAKDIGKKYLDRLTNQELYTTKNLILLGQLTKSINERGFRVFYNEESSKKAELIIRLKKGFEQTTAKQYADYIFVTGDLDKYYRAAIRGESVDWTAVERMFKEKLASDFVDENVLRVRVATLNVLKDENSEYWSEYIKRNIELISKYGTDTTRPEYDAILLNNFIFNGILTHSKQVANCNWFEMDGGVIRRNPNNANHIDTYANLLYKAGDKKVKRSSGKRKLSRLQKIQDMHLGSIERNLKSMKNNDPTWTTGFDN